MALIELDITLPFIESLFFANNLSNELLSWSFFPQFFWQLIRGLHLFF